jgi:DNA-binding LacI/PurR family transcriptional regulator
MENLNDQIDPGCSHSAPTAERGATISQVAARAGVSRQTVSNVLNAPGRVAPETAERVRAAIAALGYRPNRTARNLRNRASRNIGFKFCKPAGLNNLMDRFLHSLADAAEPAGYHILLFTTPEPDANPGAAIPHIARGPEGAAEDLTSFEELIGTGTVDGFVIADVGADDPRPMWCVDRGVPCVSFGRPLGTARERSTWVEVDGADGLAQAVDHLVARGHRRIAYLGWPEGNRVGDERRTGWREAMLRHGLDVSGLVGGCAEDPGEVRREAGRLLALPDPPTAFACGSDTFAMAARQAGGLDAHGVPNVEVVGYDDSPALALMVPPLASVRQPVDEVARCVVELLLARIRTPGLPSEGVMLRPELITRG